LKKINQNKQETNLKNRLPVLQKKKLNRKAKSKKIKASWKKNERKKMSPKNSELI